MEELSKKTTILFSPELHRRLKRVAEQRGVSIGELVRDACIAQYGISGSEARVRAVREMAQLQLPVGTPEEMERESVADPDELTP